jgi:hypothetical protein
MIKIRLFIFILLCFTFVDAWSQQQGFYSIHQEQSEQNKLIGHKPALVYDFFNGFARTIQPNTNADQTLAKRVFGYFPYWAGSNYLNYQWNLLSDLCYFSCEIDPITGIPTNLYDWETSPAIDSALANGVKVHLCVTIFSGHAVFFNSPAAQQTLIGHIITLIQQRGAHGVNMDVEALPSSLGNAFTEFIIALSEQVHTAIPGCEVSMKRPPSTGAEPSTCLSSTSTSTFLW